MTQCPNCKKVLKDGESSHFITPSLLSSIEIGTGGFYFCEKANAMSYVDQHKMSDRIQKLREGRE